MDVVRLEILRDGLLWAADNATTSGDVCKARTLTYEAAGVQQAIDVLKHWESR